MSAARDVVSWAAARFDREGRVRKLLGWFTAAGAVLLAGAGCRTGCSDRAGYAPCASPVSAGRPGTEALPVSTPRDDGGPVGMIVPGSVTNSAGGFGAEPASGPANQLPFPAVLPTAGGR